MMEVMTGRSSEFMCSVGYNAEVPCVEMCWRGYATTPIFRETSERVLDVIKERRATLLLGDIKEFVLISADDQTWLNENWVPRLIAAGVTHIALVQSIYYFNRVAVGNVVQKIDQAQLYVGYFEDAAAGRQWLSENNGTMTDRIHKLQRREKK